MSTFLLIGVRVSRRHFDCPEDSKLFVECSAPFCDHEPVQPYCHRCGRPRGSLKIHRAIEEYKPEGNYASKWRPVIGPYTVFMHDHMVDEAIVSYPSFFTQRNDGIILSVSGDLISKIDKIRSDMRSLLLPLEMWSEVAFGVHAFQTSQ